ncbi:unnamed protein product [Bursaphelenchus xylophilus]|uniref:(pine wood nematode) hypothetical protein n=1 Tax=Bursaphelenchus xylophilus TaxID=6326 RepID=A0A1I7STW7_BURXY|nr:unnamed protein product [Bursaphelenchus xylophilus]CAG9107864.1 unnamed protein product [Bursaphelenchus xylophilus]
MEINQDLILAILDNPNQNFTSFLFESDAASTIKLLSETVSRKNGHKVVIQCLSIWQDFQQSDHPLSVILDELQHANKVDSVEGILRLLNGLLEHSPDPIAKIRVRRELEELEFDRHLKNVCQRFDSNVLDQLISNFFLLFSGVQKENNISVIPVVRCRHNDADSGTFSSEDEDMNSQHDSIIKNPEIAEDLNSLLLALDDHEQLKLLIKQLKSVKNVPDVLKNINENLKKPLTSATPPPPPPPPLPSTSSPSNPPPLPAPVPVPPPPPPSLNGVRNGPLPPPPPLGKPGPGLPPPGPPPVNGIFKPPQKQKVEIPASLKPKILPAEGKKLRHLQWTKIPVNGLQNESNIWLNMSVFGTDLISKLNFKDLDQYFEVSETTSELQQPKEEKENKSNTVSLLNSKRSLSVNVFLRASKGVENLTEFFKKGESEAIGVEQLKMLVPLLPTEEECQTLNNYTGDREQLGSAEQFLLQIMGVPFYKTKLDCMILKEEFAGFIDNVQPELELLIRAGKDLKSSASLKKVLYILLHMGNYLNHGAGVGNAVAFKLTSLWKIDELKAKKSDRTLLNLVAQEAQKLDIHLEELSFVQDAAKVSFELLKSEVKSSMDRIQRLENQLTNKNDAFFNEFRLFLERSKEKVKKANSLLENIELLRKELAIYFCENEKTFSLEECFKILANFLTKYKNAMNENMQREERQSRMQERGLPSVPSTPITVSAPSTPRVTSPSSSRKPSIITEQDRGRESFPLTPYNQRRKSSARRESVFNNVGSGCDLGVFIDGALNSRKSSRVSQSPVFNGLRENTEEKCSEEIISEIPQKIVNFMNNKDVRVINEKPPVQPEMKSTSCSLITQPSASISESSVKGIPRKSTTVPSKSPPVARKSSSSPVTSNDTRQPNATTSKTLPATKNLNIKQKEPGNKPPAAPNSSTSSRTVLRRVPDKLMLKENEDGEEIKSVSGRRMNMSKIRTKSSTAGSPQTERRHLPTCPVKPSDIRANRIGNSPSSPSWARQSAATPLQKTTLESIPSRSTISPRLSKTISVSRPVPASNTSPRTSTTTSRQNSTVATSRVAAAAERLSNANVKPLQSASSVASKARSGMNAAERRSVFKKTDSVSTASRPALIKTGSISDKPRWLG